MKKESIEKELLEMVKKLLGLARDLTWNSISDNCLYIISEIKHSDKNFFEQFKTRVNENNKKKPKTLTEVVAVIENLYSNLYDLNLYVYKANKNFTLIEIRYSPRSSLDKDYRKIVETKETMLHCKVDTPAYYTETKEKFDIHWQFGTLNHKWKMFWWQQKFNQITRKRNRKF